MNATSPEFSIIVPVYDRTQMLRESVRSLLNQSLENFEILLITDGSPEDTLEVVDELALDSRVKTFKFLSNSGNACRGRNKGIEIARAPIVCFHDSDDIAHPKRLEWTREVFHQHDADGVYGPTVLLADGTRNVKGLYNGQLFDPPEFSYDQLKKINLFMTCSVAVKRQSLLLYGGFRTDMRYREDHELWLRLAFHGVKWVRCPNVLSYYRLHGGNAEIILSENDDQWFSRALQRHVEEYDS